MHAEGTFEVQLKHEVYDEAPGAVLARAKGDKTFAGDLVATSRVEMLSARGATPGDAAYVAIERVVGTLGGRRGSFVLYHVGLAEKGAMSLEVRVAPGSGTDELVGLRGRMTIDIRGGRHFYAFEHELG
jgi:hypothetical protein